MKLSPEAQAVITELIEHDFGMLTGIEKERERKQEPAGSMVEALRLLTRVRDEWNQAKKEMGQ